MQIEFLEVRLAEVMAYADIPPSMRPALSEYDPTGLMHMQAALSVAGAAAGAGALGGMPMSPSGKSTLGVGAAGVGGPGSTVRPKELEAIKSRIGKTILALRGISQSLCECNLLTHVAS